MEGLEKELSVNEKLVNNCNSFDELYKIIRSFDSIEGSQKHMIPKRLFRL
jgi:hypothetical protein